MTDELTQPPALKGMPHTPARISRACYSLSGPNRERNEDACSLPPRGAAEQRLGTLLVVADGVGGMRGGADASWEAAAYLQALFYASAGPDQPEERLRVCFEGVNDLNRLAKESQPDQTGSQPDQPESRLTTLVAVVIRKDQVWVANIGDSRAYHIRASNGMRQQLTEDHSSQVRMQKAGLPSEAGVVESQKGIITRAIGMPGRCQPDIYHYTWEPGDRLVLCSDGLASLKTDEMSSISLQYPPRQAARELVERAVQIDGSDNCTALVAAWEDTSSPPNAGNVAPGGESLRRTGLRRREGKSSERAPLSLLVLYLLLGLILGWLSAVLVYLILTGTGANLLY